MTMLHTGPRPKVAVIGAGPGGLAAARWLVAAGFAPVIFEAADALGGQWNRDNRRSATWKGMRTNTSRVMTAFSDLDHAPGTPVYPRQEDVLAYLGRYAETFGLARRIRAGCPVAALAPADGGWTIRSGKRGQTAEEVFSRVVVATGRHATAQFPEIEGLAGFTGRLCATHTARYRGAKDYAGASVVVAGCSISALEVASDLALGGAGEVAVAYRRQRYVVPKLVAGVPADHLLFTRAAARAAETLPPVAHAEALKAQVLRIGGSPEQFGAPAPDPDILAAGISQSQAFLPCVAEGRIVPKPWIVRIEGRIVHFADGSSRTADAILFGTGFRLSLPWLAPEIARTAGLDAQGMTLAADTFHPELPGLAFLGLYDLVGPYLPVLELQARWIAQVFAGTATADVPLARTATLPMHAQALRFARLAGAEPDLSRRPELLRALLFGPLSPASFRLDGPDALPDAPARVAEAAAAFGHIAHPEMTEEERDLFVRIGAEPEEAA